LGSVTFQVWKVTEGFCKGLPWAGAPSLDPHQVLASWPVAQVGRGRIHRNWAMARTVMRGLDRLSLTEAEPRLRPRLPRPIKRPWVCRERHPVM
jgi:hypothetical protein